MLPHVCLSRDAVISRICWRSASVGGGALGAEDGLGGGALGAEDGLGGGALGAEDGLGGLGTGADLGGEAGGDLTSPSLTPLPCGGVAGSFALTPAKGDEAFFGAWGTAFPCCIWSLMSRANCH